VFGYVAKPWHPKDLLSMLRRAVETYQLLGEKECLLRELKQKNQELEQLLEETRRLQGEKIMAERWAALGRMAGMVAHDLRSPLTTIQCHAGLLEDLIPPADRLERSVRCILRQVEHMRSYVEELLLFSTPGNTGEAMRSYPVGALLASLQEAFAARCRNRNISLETRVTFTGAMWINPSKIYRVLENLLQNALDAAGEGGQIIVGADRQNEREVLLRVADSGTGIPEEIRSTLFEPFVSCGKPGGTGLGLAIVNKIIHEHGGRVWEERWELTGACFHLILPLLPSDEAEAPSPGGSEGKVER
jgi:signal transduction histidine kinase